MPQAMKIPDAKAAVDRGMEKARGNPSMGLEKSQEQKGSYSGSAKRQHESPLFFFIDGHVQPQKCGVKAKATGVQRQSRAQRRHCKGRFWSLRSLH